MDPSGLDDFPGSYRLGLFDASPRAPATSSSPTAWGLDVGGSQGYEWLLECIAQTLHAINAGRAAQGLGPKIFPVGDAVFHCGSSRAW